jgi:RHS repeat-associated protein
MTAESGTGDGTASRSLSYDLAGLLVGVGHPSGTIGYTYDDRGLLTDVSGPGGTATYSYDDAGRMIQRVDAAGTASFTWTPRFELDTVTDPATGTTLDYTWDAASELTEVDYGTSGAVRTYSYDGQGRLKTDTLVDDTSTTVVSDVYGYDSDSNLTSKTIVLPGNSAAGTHTYTYDYADRLTSWTDPSSTTVDYTWDLAGNRVEAGSDTFTYDQRNRLISGPEGDYTYTARGTLETIDTTRVYDYDPLGRLTSAEGVTYSYDGLDRVATRGTDDFEYSGPGFDPVTDANQTYTRTPGGHLLSITDGTSDLLAGVDRHGDLTHLYNPDGTITDTASYNPFGEPLDTTGSFDPTVGYQSDWTDPTTTHVWQGARWYQPAWAGFLSRDTVRGELATPVTLNRYTYANNNPLNYWDPYGQQPIDLTYGGQNCEINYACGTTPAQKTASRPVTPTTASIGAADTALTSQERYGIDYANHVGFEASLGCYYTMYGCGGGLFGMGYDERRATTSMFSGVADSFLGSGQSILNFFSTGFNTVTQSTTSLAYADASIRGYPTPTAPTWTPPNITVGPQPGYEDEYLAGTIMGLIAQMGAVTVFGGAGTATNGSLASRANGATRAGSLTGAELAGSGLRAEEGVSDLLGITRNVGAGRVTVPGTGPGGY